jgi:hypothetical protein
VIPRPSQISEATSAQEVWLAFCNHVHFFSSPQAATEWFSGKSLDPILLSPDEGYELGHIRFEHMLQYV